MRERISKLHRISERCFSETKKSNNRKLFLEKKTCMLKCNFICNVGNASMDAEESLQRLRTDLKLKVCSSAKDTVGIID